jgi:hypothetical protein
MDRVDNFSGCTVLLLIIEGLISTPDCLLNREPNQNTAGFVHKPVLPS